VVRAVRVAVAVPDDRKPESMSSKSKTVPEKPNALRPNNSLA